MVATPVDEGRARSNWLATFDVPATQTIEPLADGVAATGPALDAIRAIVAGYNGDVHNSIQLTNSLPYIGDLNDGSSAQAPAGFIRIAVIEGVAAVRGARIVE